MSRALPSLVLALAFTLLGMKMAGTWFGTALTRSTPT